MLCSVNFGAWCRVVTHAILPKNCSNVLTCTPKELVQPYIKRTMCVVHTYSCSKSGITADQAAPTCPCMGSELHISAIAHAVTMQCWASTHQVVKLHLQTRQANPLNTLLMHILQRDLLGKGDCPATTPYLTLISDAASVHMQAAAYEASAAYTAREIA